MNRKKFVTLFSTGIIGSALLKVNPLNTFTSHKNSDKKNSVEAKINPYAIPREKSGKKNG